MVVTSNSNHDYELNLNISTLAMETRNNTVIS